jgi:hypothetical protein
LSAELRVDDWKYGSPHELISSNPPDFGVGRLNEWGSDFGVGRPNGWGCSNTQFCFRFVQPESIHTVQQFIIVFVFLERTHTEFQQMEKYISVYNPELVSKFRFS